MSRPLPRIGKAISVSVPHNGCNTAVSASSGSIYLYGSEEAGGSAVRPGRPRRPGHADAGRGGHVGLHGAATEGLAGAVEEPGFAGSDGPLSRNDPRGKAPAAKWPRRVLRWGACIPHGHCPCLPSRQLRGSACGSASRQSDTPDGLHRSKVGPATNGLATRRPRSLTSGRDFEVELERPVCQQVIAGPRNHERRGASGRTLTDHQQ